MLGRTLSASCLVTVTVLTLSLASCTSGTSGGPDANLREDAGVPAPGADEEMDQLFELPIHAYMFTVVEENTLYDGQALLVEECMRDLGFSFTRAEPRQIAPGSVAAFGPQHNYLSRWHVDAEYAAEYGFSHPEELLEAETEGEEEGEPRSDPRIDHEGQTYEDAVAALTGFPEGTSTPSGDPVPEWGCTGWAEAELDDGVRMIGVEQAQSGEVPTPLGGNPLATEISNNSQEEAAADPTVLEAEVAWAECMAESGYPGEQPETVGSGRDTGIATEDTVAALRNIECREETSLTQTFLDVVSEIQERDIAANQTALQERAEEMEQALEQAVQLLEG